MWVCAVLAFAMKAVSKVTVVARTIVVGWAFTMCQNNMPRMFPLREDRRKNKTSRTLRNFDLMNSSCNRSSCFKWGNHVAVCSKIEIVDSGSVHRLNYADFYSIKSFFRNGVKLLVLTKKRAFQTGWKKQAWKGWGNDTEISLLAYPT